MSLGGSTFLKNATMLEQLLEEINFQRTKEMRQLLKDESGFVVLQGTTYWTDLFVRHFLFQEEQAIDCDDLLFFVRKRHVKGSSRYLPKYETEVEVFRKDSKKLPIGDPEIDWEETVYLNLIVHQFDYTLTLAICTRTSPKELQVLKRHSQKVYASPSRRKMDTKGEGEEMTYPHICFMVDNFDEVFCDIVVRDGEMVCVELVARGRGGVEQAVIFLGSIRYDALTRVYESRQTSLSTKVAQRMSFGLLGSKAAGRCEFVRMKGPGGKGHAEMAVSRPAASGLDTPASEPGLPLTDLWDDDWDTDPEEMFMYRHQRRLSDPSANLNNFVRGGWRTKDPKDKSRSENEGLDALVNGLAEIEAGDLRSDERRGSRASSGRARAESARMRDICPRGADDVSSPACLHVVSPRRCRPAASAARLPLRLPSGDCEMAADAAAWSETAPNDDTEDGGYKVTAGGSGGRNARALCTLPRAIGAAAAIYSGARMPPRRATPDGTHIFYWCDLPPARRPELDLGAYNPVWGMRGFSQTFHLWKEGRRQQCSPLAACLTYVTLPWWAIAKDILDHREEPILTF